MCLDLGAVLGLHSHFGLRETLRGVAARFGSRSAQVAHQRQAPCGRNAPGIPLRHRGVVEDCRRAGSQRVIQVGDER